MEFIKLFFAVLFIFVSIAALFGSGIGYFTLSHDDPNYGWSRFLFLRTLAIWALIFILTALKFILNKYKLSKKSKTGELILNHWLYNLRPFRPISTLINQVYPDERVISKRYCFDTAIVRLRGAGPLSIVPSINVNYPFPATLVETDKSYYVDRRLQDLLNFSLIFLIVFIIFTIFKRPLNSFSALYTFIFTFMILMIFKFIPILFWQVTEIRPIRKSWLTKNEQKGRRLTLSGTIPADAPFYLPATKLFNTIGVAGSFKWVFILL